MITCYNLSFEYVSGEKILKDISLKIPEGAFYFLTGASGAGKSTLLNILTMTAKPTNGRLKMFGHEVTKVDHEHLPELRRKVGVVCQDYQLLDHLSVAENVGLPLKIMGESQASISAKVKEILDWIGLGDFANKRPSVLSGGQQQRVAIARAVINNPPLLIADEPSGSLDPHLSRRLMYLFEALNKMGTTIIFATHDESLVKGFSYPRIHIEDGLLVEGKKS